jgi:energy-coupling factor transporter ATP-binding protein EcfA2
VPTASALRLSDNNNYKVEDANHLTICKPPTKEHPSYYILLECLKTFMKKQNTRPMPPLPCYEVALEDKANKIHCLFQKESIIALIGMGGIGKTTLSRKMYHLFHNQYDKSSFLEDVKSKDINNVKKQLLRDLCHKKLCKDQHLSKEDLDAIKQCMILKNKLVVVDDVGKNFGILLQLLTDKDVTNVNSKSKILVNCRNWQILKYHVKESSKMDMTLLEEEQARELFMFHAFKYANHVTNDIKNISMEIIKACGGLPLSLEVLGSYLCNISTLQVWKDALHTLRNGKNITGGSEDELLWTTLRISYDQMDKDHQNMFLDIACFLVGFKKTTLCRMYWNVYDSCSPMLILQNLEERSLIKWAKDGGLYMHEQLQDMGRNIATEEPMNRFMWKPNIYLQYNKV